MTKPCSICTILKELTEFAKAKTCKDGHRSYCKVCHNVKKQAWADANREHVRQVGKQWKLKNPTKVTAIKKKWRDSNKDYHYSKSVAWRLTNPEKARAQVNHRRRKLRNAQPLWADQAKISDLYLLAAIKTKESSFEWHVDHIIPLQGELVSGLHVETNLQVIPARENLQKSNHYEVLI